MQLKYGLNASYSGTLVPGHGSSRPGLRRGLTRRIDTLVGALAIVLLLASTAALAAKPGNSLNAKACQKNGWTGLYTRSGDPFSSEQACTSYAAKGEQLIVQAALACLNNGWMALGPTSSQQFASEQACVDFANGGGTPVAAGSDLAVAKSVSDPSPNVGDQITFTVTLTNAGPDTATGVQVTDQLPAGLTFVSANPSQGFYESASGLWTVGTVSTAIPQTLAITATVVSPDARTNTATITDSDQFDPDTDNNSATATVTPQQADLAVAKSVSDPTPNVGDQTTFTITLANFGPGDATGVQVTDQLPAGLTFVSANPSQGSYDSISGLWAVGTVTAGTPQTLEITATVVSPDPRTNTATITNSDQFDPDTDNNSATATVTPQQADLAVAKSVSDPSPNVGDQITFTITLANFGPGDATGVQVTDQLPAGLTFVSANPSQGSYESASGLWTVGTVSTAIPQTLAITATVVSPDARTNTATITDSDQFDPDTDNNSATATETPGQQTDLAVAKSVSDPTPNVGDQITFTITLANFGPGDATGVQVTDQLPAGLTFVSATPSQGSYDSASGLWAVGTVTAGTPQTLAITATVVSPDPRTNTATITNSEQFDPDTDNNSATATVTPQQADLAVAKSVSDPSPNVGDQITFTVTLTNAGPDTATGVQVTDQLPAGLTFVSANPSQGSYESASGLWTVGTVSTAIPQTLEITATVVSPDPRTNTATITNSDQFDPDTANNSATATVTPQQADLAVAKSTSDPTPNVGDTVTFTVTLFDNGPDDATNVAVADLLPDTFSFVSAIPSQGTYDSVTGEWTVGTVTTGAPQTLEITAIVVSASPGGNTATITDSDQFDPNLANNSDTTVTDPQQANLFLLKSVSDPRPHVGDTVSFTVTLIDNGPATATGVRVTDQLPAGLTFVSATPSQGTYDAETGEWTVGTVSTDTPQTLTITAIVVSLSPRTNTATITDSDQFDPNTANNSATATVTPQQADPE